MPVTPQSDSQQKKFIEAYQRQYEELIALCRDPRQCAVVAKILSIMELFYGLPNKGAIKRALG